MKIVSPQVLKPVSQLSFADDFMFGTIMRDPVICKGVIERLLQIKIDHIEYPELRTRYYQSMLDMDSLLKGHPYSELKESFILFICLNDPFGAGLPVYSFDRVCRESPSVNLHDCTHHIIYNCAAASKEENQELKDFLAFVKSNSARSDFTQEIASMVETKKFEQTFLNEYMAIKLHENDVLQRGKEEGLAAGRLEGVITTAVNLRTMGLSVSDISKATGLSEEEIRNLS